MKKTTLAYTICGSFCTISSSIQKMEELIPALKKMISYQGTVIIDIAIDSANEI